MALHDEEMRGREGNRLSRWEEADCLRRGGQGDEAEVRGGRGWENGGEGRRGEDMKSGGS